MAYGAIRVGRLIGRPKHVSTVKVADSVIPDVVAFRQRIGLREWCLIFVRPVSGADEFQPNLRIFRPKLIIVFLYRTTIIVAFKGTTKTAQTGRVGVWLKK